MSSERIKRTLLSLIPELESEIMFFTTQFTISSSAQCLSQSYILSGEENSEKKFLKNCSFCCKGDDPIFYQATLSLISPPH